MPDAADIVVAQQAEFEDRWKRLTKRQHRLVARSLATLEQEIMSAEVGSWTAAEKASTMTQLAQAVRGLSSKQLGMLRRALPGFAEQAQGNVADYLQDLDAKFLGVSRPMEWAALDWLEDTKRPLLASRLKIYRKSFARYGAAAVSEIEDAVAQTVLMGTPWTEARDAVWAATRDVVGDRQWMVDRIVRTETAVVANSITMAALLEEDEEDDPMLKKLVATFDKVTAADSHRLHGQTRRVTEMFSDPLTGREFDAPPNRPNDREVLVGWRESWGDDSEFDADTATPVDEEREGWTAEDLDVDMDAAIAREVEDAGVPEPVVNEVDARWSGAPRQTVDLHKEILARRPEMDKYSAAEYRVYDAWKAEAAPIEAALHAEYKQVRNDVITEQTARAGGGMFATDADAIRAMAQRGIKWEAHDLPPGFARMIDNELRALELSPYAPEVTEIVSEDRGGGAAMASLVRQKPPQHNAIKISIDPAGMPSVARAHADGLVDVASGGQPYLSSSRMTEDAMDSVTNLYSDIVADPVGIAHLIRHEFSHGIDFNVGQQLLSADMELMSKAWKHYGGLSFRSYGHASLSRYSATNLDEFFAESVSLAISDGNVDGLPSGIRAVVSALLGWEELPAGIVRFLSTI